MDTVARLIVRGCLLCALALAALFAPRAHALEYDGPETVPARRVLLVVSAVGANPCATAACTVGQAETWMATARGGTVLCWVNGGPLTRATDANLQEFPSISNLIECSPSGGGYAGSASIGSVVNACTGELILTGSPGAELCRSKCFPHLNAIVTAHALLSNPLLEIPKACIQVSSLQCEFASEQTAATTFAGQMYRTGTWRGTGTSCLERDPDVTYVATQTTPLGTAGSSGSLDSTDKANLAATAANTSATGALAAKLDAIKAAVAPAITGGNAALDCSAPFACNGDAARCAELLYARRAYCNMEPVNVETTQSASALGEALMLKDGPAVRADLKSGTVDVSKGLERPRIIGTSGCPAPVTTTLAFGPVNKTFTVGFQPFCDLAAIIQVFVIMGASMVGLRIFAGGFA